MDKNKEKLSKFADVLSQLRKERGISQKKAATDLGISQALLSHYEKGIRECGLDFVIKCSNYYGVTADYLLGTSKSRTGLDSAAFEPLDKNGSPRSVGTLTVATKNLLDVAAAAVTGNSEKNLIYDYYMLSLYRGALTLAKAGVLPKELFRLDYSVARELASAAIAVQDARFVFVEDKSRTGLDFSDSSALAELIKESEEYIVENFVLE